MNLTLGDGALFGRSSGFGLVPSRAASAATLGLGSASSWRPELWGLGWQSGSEKLRTGLVVSRTPRDGSADGRGFVLDMLQDDSPSRLARRDTFQEDQLAAWLGGRNPQGGWQAQGLVRRLPPGSAHARNGMALALDRKLGALQLRGTWVRSEHRLIWAQARWQQRQSPGLQLDLWHGRQGERRDFAQVPLALPSSGPGLGMASGLTLPLGGFLKGGSLELQERRHQWRDAPTDLARWQREWSLGGRLARKGHGMALQFSSISSGTRYALQFQKSLGPRVSLHYHLKGSAEPGAGARSSFFQIRVEQDRSEARFHVLLRDQGAARLGQLFFPVPGLPQLESGSGDSDRLGLGLQRETGVGRYGHGRIAVALERVIRFREKREGAFTVREPRDRWRMGVTWSWFPG